ncbi:hypothetical protein FA13DRAFT_1477311 [Coprinellus micaceus]|uniref:Uncharacterized protein n=1 Tax=Coprinellus micaceus TaxID=71717 RepID=A0A4Y7SLP9_COPMI|nr:hypothetical protein FA13DRAFT_1477311 [Coprinellus micaceus]
MPNATSPACLGRGSSVGRTWSGRYEGRKLRPLRVRRPEKRLKRSMCKIIIP